MGTIIWSICAIGIVIAIGWTARRSGIVTEQGVATLSGLTYWVTSPAMLFHALASADIASVISAPLLVAAGSGIGSALCFALIARLALGLRGGDLALGAMSSSLNNAAYIGIPIAVYVLGDATSVVPILVFQLGFFTPMFFVLADVTGSGRAPTPASIVMTIIRNPMVIAAAIGMVVAALGLPIPLVVEVTTSMLSEAAPPTILLAFGASLVGRTLKGDSSMMPVALASLCKLIVQPAIACLIGLALDLTATELMTVTIMAGLPTAQNAFIAATRAGSGIRIAQGAVLVTTLASLPLTVATAWIFHAALGL